MLFTKFLATASLVATAIAQNSRIAFTVLPSTMNAGQDITLHWDGGDGSPVTLTLQQGTTDNLKTVELVTGSATGTSYTWKVPSTLPDASNYAFRIQQGDTEPNYTGMITSVGGSSGSVTSSAASATSSKKASSSEASSSKKGGAVVGGGAGSKSKPTSAASVTSAAGNSTTAATKATTTGKAAVGSASAATGTTLHRNTTMSKAKLSSSSTSATSSVAATTTQSEESATSAGTAPSSTHTGNAASSLAGNLALVVFAFAGVAYLA